MFHHYKQFLLEFKWSKSLSQPLHWEFCCCFHSLSHVQFFMTSWTATCHESLSFTISHSLFKFTSIESVSLSHLILYNPLLLSSIFPSLKVFSNESAHCIRWPKNSILKFIDLWKYLVCEELKVCPSSEFICWNHTTNVIILGDETFGE